MVLLLTPSLSPSLSLPLSRSRSLRLSEHGSPLGCCLPQPQDIKSLCWVDDTTEALLAMVHCTYREVLLAFWVIRSKNNWNQVRVHKLDGKWGSVRPLPFFLQGRHTRTEEMWGRDQSVVMDNHPSDPATHQTEKRSGNDQPDYQSPARRGRADVCVRVV
jgi:hypothetical protein